MIHLGGGRHNKAAGLVECGILLSILISVVIAVAGMIGCGWIFRQFGARGNTLVLVMAYMNIWFFGCVTGTLSGLGNSLLIAAGDARTAAVMMMAGMVFNALLDPLMIFGLGPLPAMGIRGSGARRWPRCCRRCWPRGRSLRSSSSVTGSSGWRRSPQGGSSPRGG